VDPVGYFSVAVPSDEPKHQPEKEFARMHVRTKTSLGIGIAAAALTAGVALPATASATPAFSMTQVFKNTTTGTCLDSNSAGNVYTGPCNGGNYQNWENNGSTLVNAQTHRCLDSNFAGNVYTGPCNGGNYQKWNFINHPSGISLQNVATERYLDVGLVYTPGGVEPGAVFTNSGTAASNNYWLGLK
jgi:hypothetical protein